MATPVTPYIPAFNSGLWGAFLQGRSDLETYVNSARVLDNLNPTVEGALYKRPGTEKFNTNLLGGNFVSWEVFPKAEADPDIVVFNETNINIFASESGASVNLTYPSTWGNKKKPVYTAVRNNIMVIVKADMPPHVVTRTDAGIYDVGLYNIQKLAYQPYNTDRSTKIGQRIPNNAAAPEFDFKDIDTRFTVGERLLIDTGATTSPLYLNWAADGVYVLGDYVVHDGRAYYVSEAGEAGPVPPTHKEPGDVWGEDGKAKYVYVFSEQMEFEVVFQNDPYDPAAGVLRLRIRDAYLPNDYNNYTTIALNKFVPRSIAGQSLPSNSQVLGYSYLWAREVWSADNGYPSLAVFHNSRLVLAASSKYPQTLWGSRIDDYVDFFVPLDFVADNPYSFTMAIGAAQTVSSLTSDKDLFIGTDDTEVVLQVSSDGLPSFVTDTTYGQEGVGNAVKAPNAILFVQRGGAKVREITYQDENKSYVATDLTRYVTGLFDEHQIKQIRFQTRPTPTLWVLRSDGVVATAIYDWREQVLAWNTHTYNMGEGKIEDILVVEQGVNQEVFFLVKYGAAYGQVILRSSTVAPSGFNADTYLDGANSFTGQCANITLNDFAHLEGQNVVMMVQENEGEPFALGGYFVVAGGSVVVGDLASGIETAHKFYVGMPYVATYESQAIEGYSPNGSAQGKGARITGSRLRVYKTGEGARIFDAVVPMRSDNDSLDSPTDFISGFTQAVKFSSRRTREPVVQITHDLPTPFNLIGVMLEITTEDRF